MGCCTSFQGLDRDRIHSPIVLLAKDDVTRYHGTTERSRFQTLGRAELVLTEDGLLSQVLDWTCCTDKGFIYIPLRTVTDIHEQAWFNGLYRIDHPHLVVTYVIPDRGEFQAGWQMNETSFQQWKRAIEILIEHTNASHINS